MTTEMNDDMANDSTSDRADGEFVPWGPPMVPTTAGHAHNTVDAVCKFNNRKPGAPRPVGHAYTQHAGRALQVPQHALTSIVVL